MDRHVTFYHAPQSRSGSTLFLMEELGASYDLHVLNLKKNEQREPAYLAVNPMGKVPAIVHGDSLVTEQPAIFIYMADLYPESGLAPALGDPLRGPYLRWMVFYAACFEPALMDKSMKNPPAPPSTCPYGDYDTVMRTITDQLKRGPYLLGERFSAADVLWANALDWTTMFQLVEKTPEIAAYIERVTTRPAAKRASEKDAALAAAQA